MEPASIEPPVGARRRFALGLGLATIGTLPLLLYRSGGGPRPLDRNTAAAQAAALRLAGAVRIACSMARQSGVGLLGEYFASARPGRSPFLVRTDPAIDLDAGDLEAIRALRHLRPRSARWTGWIKPLIAGDYGFAVEGARARVNVGRQPFVGADAAAGACIAMVPGRFYPVSIEVEGIDERTASVRLDWRLPHGTRLVVPQANLFPPSDRAAT